MAYMTGTPPTVMTRGRQMQMKRRSGSTRWMMSSGVPAVIESVLCWTCGKPIRSPVGLTRRLC